jgi:ABC-type uncharacterized transport system permease subunit
VRPLFKTVAARQLLTVAVALAAGLILLTAGLSLAGYPPGRSLTALWEGAFGSWYALTSATMLRSVPLITIGLGIALSFRAGALNIGADGQFYAGAMAATAVGLHVGHWPAALAIGAVWVAAMIAGVLWVSAAVLLRLRFGVLEVISTLLLNFIALALVSLMVTGPLQEARHTYPQSDLIADAARLPVLPGSRLHLGFLASVGLALGLWILFRRTIWGFRLLATGTGPRAAAITGGIDTERTIAAALLGSAAFAGLAGGLEVSGVSYALFQSLSPGYGFTGIAVALLARLHPLGVVATGFLFAALEAGAGAMQRDAGVPSVAVYVVEAVIIVVVLLSDAYSRRIRTAQVLEDSA